MSLTLLFLLTGPTFGARHVQVVLLFFLVGIAYFLRVNLSVGIVAMTDPTVNPGITVKSLL